MKLADTGLRLQPFQTRGKPLVLVPCRPQKAAIQFLDETRCNAHGLGLLHGPRLSGKTSVIHQFKVTRASEYAIAIVDGDGKKEGELFREILQQFGFDYGFDSVNEVFGMVRVFARQRAVAGDAPLLIIENAHAMNPMVLEMLCELAEETVGGKSALRIVLASHKPMLPIIQSPAMESMSKRVTGKFLMQPLTRSETANYVYRKLIAGGCKNPQYIVPQPVCDLLHQGSGGWPGRIDHLAMSAIANAKRFPLQTGHVPLPPSQDKGQMTKATPMPQLIVTHARKTLSRVNLVKPRLIIGRDDFCGLQIVGEWISRHHAALFRNDKATIVVDLDSKNGTFVNGERISQHVLVNNDIISLGDHRVKFIDPSAKRRISLRAAGWDDTAITKSMEQLRRAAG
jgi:type II secretory pathway predicted ATPase ExeA